MNKTVNASRCVGLPPQAPAWGFLFQELFLVAAHHVPSRSWCRRQIWCTQVLAHHFDLTSELLYPAQVTTRLSVHHLFEIRSPMNLFAEFQTRVATILTGIAGSGRLPADLDLGRFVVEPTPARRRRAFPIPNSSRPKSPLRWPRTPMWRRPRLQGPASSTFA